MRPNLSLDAPIAEAEGVSKREEPRGDEKGGECELSDKVTKTQQYLALLATILANALTLGVFGVFSMEHC